MSNRQSIFANLSPGGIKQQFSDSPFLRHNFIFFFGTLLASVLNYLFYPVLSHMLNPAVFGEVQALFSLFLQAAIFFSVLNYVTVHITTHYEGESRNHLLFSLEHYATIIAIIFTAVGLMFASRVANFLNFSSAWPFVALLGALLLTLPLSFRMSYLQGMKKFGQSAASNAIGSALKILFAAILIAAGWKSFGAVVGLALSQIVSLAFAFYWARKAGLTQFGWLSKSVSLNKLKPQLTYALFVLVISLGVMAILSIDIIAVKHYFPPEQAGLYAGIATIARIVYFLTGPFAAVLLASVSLKQKDRKNQSQLMGGMVLVTIIGGLILLVLVLMPRLVVTILVGAKYLPYVGLLPRISLAMYILSITNLLLTYHVALRRYSFMVVITVGFVMIVALVINHHQTVGSIIDSILLGSIILLLITAFWSLVRKYVPKPELSWLKSN